MWAAVLLQQSLANHTENSGVTMALVLEVSQTEARRQRYILPSGYHEMRNEAKESSLSPSHAPGKVTIFCQFQFPERESVENCQLPILNSPGMRARALKSQGPGNYRYTALPSVIYTILIFFQQVSFSLKMSGLIHISYCQ